MRRHENRSSRAGVQRRDRHLVLVVCGGARTEPDYFKGLRRSRSELAVNIRVVAKPRSPEQMVAFAARRSGADFDEVWCVFDVDEFEIGTAVTAAQLAGIQLAVSNPCFELWLLLHHEDCRVHLVGYQAVVAKLRRYRPLYDKAKIDFVEFADNLPEAVKRAKALEPTGLAFRTNPSTSVWRLIERVMGGDDA